MKSKRLLQKVNLQDKNKKVRPTLVESDHPLLESYDDIKEFFNGTVRLAIPEIVEGKNKNEIDQVEYFSPFDGNVEKISNVEFENKVKPEIESLLKKNKDYNFDEEDPDQFEKKALLDAFKLPSGDISEYIVKVDNYYVLCNWGLENAPKIGELPPPPPPIRKEPEPEVIKPIGTPGKSGIGEDEEPVATTEKQSGMGGSGEEGKPGEGSLGTSTETEPDDPEVEDENEIKSWLRENWLKILLGILIFILLLLLIRECEPGDSGTASRSPQTSEMQPENSDSDRAGIDNSNQGQAENGQTGELNRGESSPNLGSDTENDSSVKPSPPSSQSPPIVRDRAEELVEKEDDFSDGIPTDQWDEIGAIFQMKTEEGIWYWLRLKNGDTHLIEFIPFGENQKSEETSQSNYNTI